MTEPAANSNLFREAAPDERIPVRVPTEGGGSVVRTVAQEDFDRAVAEGAKPATTAELEAQRQADANGTFGDSGAGAALAGATGLASTATFGASDWLAKQAAGLVYGDQGSRDASVAMQQADAAHPYIHTAGELGGMFLNPIAGEAGAAVKGLTEAGIGARLGTGLLSRALTSGLTEAASGATEMGLYGAGNAISDAAIKDHDLTAEQLLSSVGHDALLGAAGGFALGGGLKLAGEGLGAAKAALTGGEKAEAAALPEAEAAAGGVPPTPPATTGATGAAAGAPIEAAAAPAEKPTSWLSEKLGDLAQDKTLQSTGATKRQIEQLADKGPQVQQRAMDLLQNDITEAAGKSSFRQMTPKTMAEGAQKVIDRTGDSIGEALKGAAAAGAKADINQITSRAYSEIIAPMSEQIGSGPAIEKVRGVLGDMLEKSDGKDLEWMQQARRRIDKLAKYGKQNGDDTADAFKALRGIVEDEIGNTIERGLGGDALEQYAKDKATYQAALWIRDASENGVARGGTNRSISWGDHLSGVVGSVLGGMPGAVAGTLISKGVRHYGDQITADLAYRASGLSRISAEARRAEIKTARAVDAAVGAGNAYRTAPRELPAALKPRAGETRSDAVRRTVDQLAALKTNPAEADSRFRRAFGNLADHAPQVAAAAKSRMMSAVEYLLSKAPPTQPDGTAIGPQKPPKLSPADTQAMENALKVWDDPTIVLDDIARGKVNHDRVEALKTLYPKTFADVQQQITDKILHAKTPVPYAQRIALGEAFDIPTDPSLDPERFARTQAVYAQPPQPGPQPPAAPSGKVNGGKAQSMKIATSRMTETQQLAQAE